jgi:hypothetical protein
VQGETEEQARKALLREGFGHLSESPDAFVHGGSRPAKGEVGIFETQNDLFKNAAQHNEPFFMIETDIADPSPK